MDLPRLARAAALLAAALLSACAAVAPPEVRPPAEPDVLPPTPAPAARKGVGGGVFVAGAPWSITSDSRAFRAGDLVTVVLQETTQASKRAGTSFDKSSSVSIQPMTLASKRLDTSVGIGADRDFSGSASSTQQNTLQGAITVVVQEVMANGLLRVSGEKSLTLNQGEEFVRLRGYVRAGDIDSNNRVSSQRIANARIAYSGKGVLADANSPGWLTRFFSSPWMPF